MKNDNLENFVKYQDKEFFRIGEVSEICNVSVKMLRYYDKISLCKPIFIDPDNGYRLYSKKEIELLTVVKELKNHGFKSPEIKEIIKNRNIGKIEELYSLKRNEIEKEIEKLGTTLNRLDKQIEHLKIVFDNFAENHTPQADISTEISVKKLASRRVLFVQVRMSISAENISMLINHSQKASEELNIAVKEPYILVLPERENKLFEKNNFTPSDLFQIEACVEIDNAHNDDEVFIKTIPEGEYVCMTYSENLLCQSHYDKYVKLKKWAYENGYKPEGPPIYVYINNIEHLISQKNIVIEIQILVEKIKN
jgi:DNA-binding transcriptional MerR regulator